MKVSRNLSIWLAFALLLGNLAVTQAQENTNSPVKESWRPTVNASVDALSAYVSRGQVINSSGVAEPAVSLTAPFGFSLGIWGNYDLTDKHHNRGEATEWDITIAYDLPIKGPVKVQIGDIEYAYPNGSAIAATITNSMGTFAPTLDENTRELYAQVSGDVFLNPSIKAYYDCDAISGFYVVAGVNPSKEIMERLTGTVNLSVGWASSRYNQYIYGLKDNRFNDMNVGVSLSYAINNALSVSAKCAYSFLLDSKIRECAQEVFEHKNLFYGGLNLSYVF